MVFRDDRRGNKTVEHDEVAEWLRRWTANPFGTARVDSNPILVKSNRSFFLKKNNF